MIQSNTTKHVSSSISYYSDQWLNLTNKSEGQSVCRAWQVYMDWSEGEGGDWKHGIKGVELQEFEEIKQLETYQKKFPKSNGPTTTVG